jgi:xanthine dehydrogenase YagS FAD-binding subunit
MMKNFSFVRATSIADAVKALAAKGARVHAGGTDLVGCLRDEIVAVDKVVSISGVKEMKGISTRTDGGMRIGALASVAEVAGHAGIVQKYPVLAQAAGEVASPQLRNQGTIGGNICQRPRCWYFRGDFHCAKKGGDMCYSIGGENQYHAVLDGGPCFAVHPSDTAVALSALQAQVTIAGAAGNRTVKIEDFFVGPDKNIEKENILVPGELVTEILLPAPAPRTRSSYRKLRSRGAWDFALVSVACALQLDGKAVTGARIYLGGVAPRPYHAEKAEKALIGKPLNAAAAAAAGTAAADGATPMSDNAYKVEMLKGAVEESIFAFA